MRSAAGKHFHSAARVGVLCLLLLVAACQAGPQAMPEGRYRLFATSTGPVTDDIFLELAGTSITVQGEATQTEYSVGAEADEAVLCPPAGKGRPRSLGKAMNVGDVALARPAVFGDCGTAKPARLTIVDLDSASADVKPFGFTRWVEFCNGNDRDC